MGLRRTLKRLDIWLGKVLFPNSWPDDKAERRRMKAFILAAGSCGRAARLIEEEPKAPPPCDPELPPVKK